MNNTFRLLCLSVFLIFFAWIAKMHFLPGGDLLFRVAYTVMIACLITQTIFQMRHQALRSESLVSLFIVNSVSLIVVHAGIMMKVSHIMDSQLAKDIVLDLLGMPAIALSLVVIFSQIKKLMDSSTEARHLFFKQILFPWIGFVFSFMFYALYSSILARS